MKPSIVVGVDGSEDAQSALRFAIEEARLRNAGLRLICAWELPAVQWGEMPPPEAAYDRFHHDAEEVLARAAAIVEEEAPGVECECLAPEGKPAQMLLEHASDATMLVVGTRGHGALAGLLLGSVSQEVAPKAACPVVVVPHTGS